MNEAETRAEHIDPALKAAGWGVVEGSRILREYRIALGRIEGHGNRARRQERGLGPKAEASLTNRSGLRS
jgi:type I site-specific restriction endonuclease